MGLLGRLHDWLSITGTWTGRADARAWFRYRRAGQRCTWCGGPLPWRTWAAYKDGVACSFECWLRATEDPLP